jgi:predicted nuclease with TOPRIM domain
MGLLQYTSNEMFSSTELVRKCKNIFDKLNKNEIEKAIILRDGKPGIILLDFNQYEQIISDYLQLKEKYSNANQSINKNKNLETKEQSSEEINNEDLKNALVEIEKLDFSFDSKTAKENTSEPLKEFWD